MLLFAHHFPFALVRVAGPYNYIRAAAPEIGVWFRHFRAVEDVRYYGDFVTNARTWKAITMTATITPLREKSSALRAEAYADYLRAVAASGHLRSDDDLVAAFRSAADAKTRILVYGSAEAVAALARFEEAGATLGKEHSVAAFVGLVSAMRASNAAILERDIRLVLLGATQQIGQPIARNRDPTEQ